MSQNKISSFLKSIGFYTKNYSSIDFYAEFENENKIALKIISMNNKLGAQVDFLEMTKSIIDASEISSIEEFKFFITRNLFVKEHFPTLLQALHQDQT